MPTQTVQIDLSVRSYDIVIGRRLIENIGDYLNPLLKRNRVAVVTDDNVSDAQGARLRAALDKAGIAANFIALPPGETTKTFHFLDHLVTALIDHGIERDDLIIAFGGGVVGDIAGFAAAILRRGCRFIQVPTTLLAQVDSSVGGKTAINVPAGKNLVGAFHQPSLVIADLDALTTLPAREFRAGYAEIVKYGLINDAEFFAWLEENHGALCASKQSSKLQYAIAKSCEAKAAIVAEDERETGRRALLNLGHTFGHAIETIYGHADDVLHGEAVALGTILAFEFAEKHSMCSSSDVKRVAGHFQKAGLPTSKDDLPPKHDLDATHIFNAMLQDKKVKSGALTLILPHAIGDARIKAGVPHNDVKAFLDEKF
ncbi:MAG: 3-dehydroquinate synthase [Marinicaulis sp.]|nr:3-dehydroquinate synthase [Marinicaulis sp.]